MPQTQTIYVKAKKQAKIVRKRQITVGDVADLEGDPVLVSKIKDLTVTQLKAKEKHSVLITILDIAKTIRQNTENVSVVSVGASDTIISYKPDAQRPGPLFEALKVLFVCFILFFGAALAIMTFHTDAAVPDVFVQVNKIFTGEEVTRPVLLIASYSVGIAVGIIVFFNHFNKKKITDDPTPVEVVFASYQKQVDECMVDILSDQDDFGQGITGQDSTKVDTK